jgi:hypothetical protein
MLPDQQAAAWHLQPAAPFLGTSLQLSHLLLAMVPVLAQGSCAAQPLVLAAALQLPAACQGLCSRGWTLSRRWSPK